MLLLLVLLLVMGALPLAAWANHDGNECHPNQPGCTPGGELYLQRITFILHDGIISSVRFPIPEPERDAEEVLAALS